MKGQGFLKTFWAKIAFALAITIPAFGGYQYGAYVNKTQYETIGGGVVRTNPDGSKDTLKRWTSSPIDTTHSDSTTLK